MIYLKKKHNCFLFRETKFQNGAHLKKKGGYFWPTFHNLLVTRENYTKIFKDISHSHTYMCFAHPTEFFILPYQFKKKKTNSSGMVSLWVIPAMVLILIHAILEQSINNKMVSNYTNAKFIVISKPRT